ncbi:carbon-nitrogen hydrolase family protein [Tropicibacter naphthalenivorans]|uniref:C-N hydrolase family amidase n=1 Tax=Tropicibacter naphthalenivorans TaxID=441103 RepID=A0A0P1G1Y3_9RHOB|nr:carbon-nitrogen hydrolase family protein [Tropicibacter naphthalenivorans]CUH75812.1 C-N hydrolase family amidase [Tropicibacter naphthalenivorans]SMC42105.1 Predicted amidohydrolase [Tropicibacter naphthalenivorans]
MKVATAAYPSEYLSSWQDYARKIEDWVSSAAGQGAELLVFPEYAAMELSTLSGRDISLDLKACIDAVSSRMPDADSLHSDLASKYNVHILSASAPVFDDNFPDLPVNRASLFTPTGAVGVQDKQIMTRFEREDWGVQSGGPLRLFDTSLGRIGVLICYDSEYPLLGRALSDAEVILVPSVTEALAGYWRVRIGAMARSLENQCVTVMSSVVGTADWSEVIDESVGQGGVFGPPDTGFPPTGVMAEGGLNKPGWTYAEIDPAAVEHVRRDGVVLNRQHWDEQPARAQKVSATRLR